MTHPATAPDPRIKVLELAKAHNLHVVVWRDTDLLTGADSFSQIVSNAETDDLHKIAAALSAAGRIDHATIIAQIAVLCADVSKLHRFLTENIVAMKPSIS